jgi:hypothetical protein
MRLSAYLIHLHTNSNLSACTVYQQNYLPTDLGIDTSSQISSYTDICRPLFIHVYIFLSSTYIYAYLQYLRVFTYFVIYILAII